MGNLILSGLGLIGSVFITTNKDTGNIVINVAPFIVLSLCAVSLGCSVDDSGESFSTCFVSTVSAIEEVFNL